MGQPREGHGLQPHTSRTCQRSQKYALAAKDTGLNPAGALDVVIDRRLKRDKTPLIDPQILAGSELFLDNRPTRMNERQPIPADPLEDESFSAKKAHPEFLRKRNIHLHPTGGTQKCGLLTQYLATQLIGAGRSFVGYSEDLPEAGFTGCRSGRYAQKHSPWAAFDNVPAASNQPWSAWPGDYAQLPTVSIVIPNLCNDMHDCDVAVGDRWLRQNLSGYLDWARTHNSLLIVTFDETDSQSGSNRIVTLFGGAMLRPGPVGEPVDHYRLLRTLEAMYHLPALGHAAASTPITDVWTGAPAG
jgi:hypothetical protein